MAATMRPATGSHSLRHTSSVLKIHSLRFHAAAEVGCRRAARTPARATGRPGAAPRRPRCARRRSPRGRRTLVSWLAATWRARSQLTGPLPGAASICCSWARNCCICCGSLGSGGWAARQGEAERDVGHVSTVRRESGRAGPMPGVQLRENSGSVGTHRAHETSRCHRAARCAVVAVLLAVGVMAAPVPYVVLEPGPTVEHARLGRRQGGHPGHRRHADLDVRGAAAADHRRRAADADLLCGDPRLVQRRARRWCRAS